MKGKKVLGPTQTMREMLDIYEHATQKHIRHIPFGWKPTNGLLNAVKLK